MKREQLARKLAKESRISPGAAADQLDRIVHDILKRIRRGQSASLPGVGILQPLADRKVVLVSKTPGAPKLRPS